MTPDEMAAGCVKYGVGRRVKHIGNRDWRYSFVVVCPDHEVQMTAEEVCNDGRTVLAMLDIVPAGLLAYVFAQVIDARAKDENLAPAIIEACLQALGGEE